MSKMKQTTTHLKYLAVAVAASFALAGCERPADVADDRPMPDQEPAQETAVVDEPAGAQMDLTLSQSVRTALQEDPAFGPAIQNIQITVEDGTVTLRGFVQSDEERDEVEARVEAMPGVRGVDNQLQVAGQ